MRQASGLLSALIIVAAAGWVPAEPAARPSWPTSQPIKGAATHRTPQGDLLPAAPAGTQWKLIWNDEFEGDKLDLTKWSYRGEGRRRDGWWTRKATYLDGKGNLVLAVLEEEGKFLDGCLKSRLERAYGFYVARVQFSTQEGHWSAFWLMGPGVHKVGDEGRDGTEIDIMEKPTRTERVEHNLHWDAYGKDHKSAHCHSMVPGVMKGFHTFALLWTPTEYVFYVDAKETWRTSAGGVCQAPLYILLSDEIGKWAGDIKKAKLPDQTLIDYVRVYDLVEK